MNRFERTFVLWALGYLAIYLVVAFSTIACAQRDRAMAVLLPFHLLGMAQNFAALFLTVRDLYKRPFADPNSKLTWLLLILLTGGVGWIVYVFRYAIKPRADSSGQSASD